MLVGTCLSSVAISNKRHLILQDIMALFKCLTALYAVAIARTAGQQALMGLKDDVGEIVWKDRGSGADADFSSWTSRYVNGYSFAMAYHHGQRWYDTMAHSPILAFQPYGDPNALATPTGFDWIWDDAGSGADWDVTIWRPICPEGYVSLGDVSHRSHGGPPAELYLKTRCVKEEHAYPCGYNWQIWNDRGSGAHNDVQITGVHCTRLAKHGSYITVLPEAFDADNFYASNCYDCTPSVQPYGLMPTHVYFIN